MNLRKILIAGVAITAASAMASGAFAQITANANVGVAAKLIQPITIAAGNSLDFGTATVATGTGRTLSIAPTGTRTAGTGVTLLGSAAGHAGTFTVGGENNQAFAIAFSSSLNAGYTLDNYAATGCGDSVTAATISAANACTLTVGARLNIDDAATIGTVSGTLTTTVTYN